MKEQLSRYLLHLGVIFDSLDVAPINEFSAKAAKRQKLFVGGFGRTGLILKSFAVRMNRLNLPTFVLLGTSAPPIEAGDLVLIGSGSGTTETTLATAKEVQRRSAELTAITGNLLSPLGQIADHRILIPPFLPPDLASDVDVTSPVQAGFEQALNLILDAISARIDSHLRPDRARSFIP
ncbi:MAG: 6-phospho-3-hexuloisomerase [Planctomycetota bacterium]|jgi:6-phospho-3-hexuloisomerase